MNKLIITLLLLLCSLAIAAETTKATYDPTKGSIHLQEADEMASQIIELEVNKDVEKKLTSAPGFQDISKNCKEESKKNNSEGKINLKEAKDCISAAIDAKMKEMDENAQKSLAENLNLNTLPRFKQKQGKLGSLMLDYFSERLQTALYGEETGYDKDTKKLKEKFVDPKIFYEMHKAQLSKNVLLEASTFCHTNFDDGPILKKVTNKKVDSITIDANTASNYAKLLSECLKRIPALCRLKSSSVTSGTICNRSHQYRSNITQTPDLQDPSSTGASTQSKDFTQSCSIDFGDEDAEKLVTSACNTQTRLRDFRKTIAQTTSIIEQLDDLAKKDGAAYELGVAFDKVYGNGKDDKSIDELTTVSSGIFDEKEGELGQKMAEYQKMADECEKPENKDSQACKALKVNQEDHSEEYSDQIATHEMATQLMENKIEQLGKEGDKEKVAAYLEQEGRLTEEMKKELEGASTADEITNKIKETIRRERDAELELVMDDIQDDRTSNLGNEVRDERENLQNLLQFNNVALGYLTVTQGSGDDKKESQNFGIIEYEFAGRGEADQQTLEKLREQLPDSQRGTASEQQKAVYFNADNIDGILDGF